MADLLANDTGFESPYATPDKDLTSVEAPDDRTLIFHFAGPQSDADWILSLSYTAPVPKDKDTRQDYHNHPVASGPYKIESYAPDKSLISFVMRIGTLQPIPIDLPIRTVSKSSSTSTGTSPINGGSRAMVTMPTRCRWATC